MHKPKTTLAWLVVAILLGIVPAGWADPISFSLVQANLTGTPGSTLVWQYDVTNNSGGTILGLDVSSDVFAGGTPDASVFDGFGSGIANGSTSIGNLFAFESDPTVASSFNQGIFDIFVLLDDGTTTDLTANYTATISPAQAVPEPSTLLLALAAAPLLLRSARILALCRYGTGADQ